MHLAPKKAINILQKCLFLILFTCGISINISHVYALPPAAPSECHIQDYYSPLGIDDPLPRFAWALNHTNRGEYQTAYQIIVMAAGSGTETSAGTYWDTGKVISSEQYAIAYNGRALKSATSYWWKVRTWDKGGNPSPWSNKNNFVTGFFKASHINIKTQWISAPQERVGLANANWIWSETNANTPSCSFRTTLQIPAGKAVASAKMSITADSSFTLMVNGKPIGKSNDWAIVSNIDLTAFLHAGNNIMLVDTYKPGSGKKKGGMIARIEIRFSDGSLMEKITDDQTWEVSADNGAWKPALIVAAFGSAPWLLKQFKNATVNDHSPLFRKTFKLNKKVKEAYLFISGLGVYEAFLNGKKIGNHIIPPAWTDYDKSVNYQTYDVAQMLQRGDNAMGVAIGNGWFDYQTESLIKRKGLGENAPSIRNYGVMRLFSQLNIRFDDGSTTIIATDPSWKTAESPYTLTHVFGSEQYDARLEQQGWAMAAFSDINWKQANIIEAPPGNFEAQKVPPVIERAVYTATRYISPAPNVQVFDLGQNINGQHEITVSGPAGAVLTIVPGEVLEKNGRARPTKSDYSTYSTYTLKGIGVEKWRLTFSTAGFRYIEIAGATSDSTNKSMPYVHGVKGYFTYTAANVAGNFTTSNLKYNQIYDLTAKTLYSNLVSIHTDCPTYEKLGWQEVVTNTAPSYGYLFDVQPLWTGFAQNLREAQRPGGLVPNIAPEYTRGAGNYDDAPAWGASIFALPWLHYWNYGDKKILKDNYRAMKKYLTYLKTKEDKWGVVGHGLGDWMAPTGMQMRNVEGAVYVWDIKLMRDIASVLELKEDALFYAQEFERAKNAYNAVFFDLARGCYIPNAQTNQALPLAFGILPNGMEKSVHDALEKVIANPENNIGENGNFGALLPNHVSSGDVGTTYLWRVLGESGKSELVENMILQPDAPSYYYLVKMGLTTIAENWLFDKARSMNHDMYAGILEWFYRYVAGISNTEPGYARFKIKPAFELGLANMQCSYNSIRGLIGCSWKKDGKKIILKVSAPVNTIAEVFIPTENVADITENGKPLMQAVGVKLLRMENGYSVLELGSGNYTITFSY